MTTTPATDPLELLRRRDKHYLGGGDGTLYAPPHPLWLDRPGFWDGGHIFLYGIAPLFTLALVDDDGRERPLRLVGRDWTPAEIGAHYQAPGFTVDERRVVLQRGQFVSEMRIMAAAEAPAAVTLVAWTAQEGADLTARARIVGGPEGVAFGRRARDAQLRSGEIELACVLDFTDSPAEGWAAYESQQMRSYANAPRWECTPLADRWSGDGGLRRDVRTAEEPAADGRTLVFLGISRRLALTQGATIRAGIRMRVAPAEAGLTWAAAGQAWAPGVAEPATAGDKVAQTAMDAPRSGADLRIGGGPRVARAEAAAASRETWRRFFAAAPALTCSDPFVERYFAYRWYGLRLNFIDPAGNYRHPTCAEGIEYFHCPISYSAWCHTRELRWLPDPARARGTLLTFLDHQAPDGALPGRVYLDHMRRTDFYFADWGGSLLALHEVHPERAFLASAYGPLSRFADHMDRSRDAEGSGLYDVRDPYETGQEMMSRYTAVDPAADRQHFEYRLHLKGVDLTVYTYRLRRALARAAAELGRPSEARAHDDVADRIGAAVLGRMWDPAAQLFSDVDPRTGGRTGVKAAVSFYPYLTDIPGPEHLAGLERHLFDPATFWLPYPVPSTAADDPTFDPDAVWKGVRQNCTWNGRVWPMTNSHVVDALGLVATTRRPEWRPRLAELLGRYLRMLFLDGDPVRPTCYEHYSPLTGRPCLYRGIDDYQHSWINDLIIRYIAGVRPEPDGTLTLDPIDCGLDHLRLDRLPVRGRRLAVLIDGRRVRLEVDGHLRAETELGAPLRVPV